MESEVKAIVERCFAMILASLGSRPRMVFEEQTSVVLPQLGSILPKFQDPAQLDILLTNMGSSV